MSFTQSFACPMLIILIGTANFARANCGNGAYNVSGGTGHISGPDSEEEEESCSWTFSIANLPKILILDVTRLKLYYRTLPFGTRQCTQTLTVGNYGITKSGERCKSEETFCHVYYNDARCLDLGTSMKDREGCNVFTANITKVEFTSDGNGNIFSDSEGFDMTYQYVTCITESTIPKVSTPTTPSSDAKLSTEVVLTSANEVRSKSSSTSSYEHDKHSPINRSTSTDSIFGETQNGTVTPRISEQTATSSSKQRSISNTAVIGGILGYMFFGCY